MRYFSIAIVFTCATLGVSAQQKMEKPGITNYTKVDAVVACGGATEITAFDGLKADGFKSVINLRQASERGANVEESRARATTIGLKYIHLPLNAAAPESKTVDDFLAAIKEPGNQPVFIHCGSANRVGAVWLVKRVLQDGWPIEKATAEAKLIGLSNPALEQFAQQYIAQHKK